MRSNPNVCYPKSTFSDYVLPNVTLTEVEEDGKKKMRNVPTFNLWMKEGNRRLSLHGLAFDPRYGEFCHNPRGLPCLNLYRPILHSTPSDWQTRVKPFLDHVEYLVPVQDERERFLDWLAHIEQKPGELPTAGYLMITETEGVGRNSLASVLARVWTGYVAMDVNINELLGGSFNDELACRFVAVVDEIREGTNEGFRKYAQRLKSMITATVRNLNPKFGRKREEHNCCRWLIFSNHWDALPIGEKDRRLFVIANPTTQKEPHYYTQLQRHIADPLFIHSVREWLRQRDISWFNPGEIPAFNSAKQMVIQTAKTEVEDSLDYIRAHWISDCITTSQLCLELFGSDDKSYVIKTGYKAKDAGLDKYPERIVSVEFQGHKSSERVWILRNAERWIRASKEAVIAEMQRGMNEGRMK
jgi:hypothetical protein